ncbi:MAG: hypothetical protein AB7G65_19370 [Thermoleophilia bacterium]
MGTSPADPLMLQFRIEGAEKRLDSHSDSLRRGTEAFGNLRQEVALQGRDLGTIRDDIRDIRDLIRDERDAREKRDADWEARVKRLTVAWFTVAGSLIVGAVTIAITAAQLG